MDIETKRNEWVAAQLGLSATLYRDDNCFIECQPSHFEEGATVGQIVVTEDGHEYLVDHNGEGDIPVPVELYLYTVMPLHIR